MRQRPGPLGSLEQVNQNSGKGLQCQLRPNRLTEATLELGPEGGAGHQAEDVGSAEHRAEHGLPPDASPHISFQSLLPSWGGFHRDGKLTAGCSWPRHSPGRRDRLRRGWCVCTGTGRPRRMRSTVCQEAVLRGPGCEPWPHWQRLAKRFLCPEMRGLGWGAQRPPP